jgi:hypothetical protein
MAKLKGNDANCGCQDSKEDNQQDNCKDSFTAVQGL